MPDIAITGDQRKRLEAVREDVETAFVDSYGHARLEDALQYLLDTYTPPGERDDSDGAALERVATAEYPQLQQIAAEVPEVPGSGIDADEMRGKLLAELGGVALAERLAALDNAANSENVAPDPEGEDESADDRESAGDSTSATPESDAVDTAGSTDTRQTTTSGVSAVDTVREPAPDSGDGETTDDGATETASAGGPGDGGILSSANRLLAEHDDRWRESDTGDEPYEVDLPDGSTEGARTRDDVRQLLFRHY